MSNVLHDPVFLSLMAIPILVNLVCMGLAILVTYRRKTRDALLQVASYALIMIWVVVPLIVNGLELEMTIAIRFVGYGFVALFVGATLLTVSLRMTVNGRLDSIDAITLILGGFVAGLFTTMATSNSLDLVTPFMSKDIQMFGVPVATGISMSLVTIWLGWQIKEVSSKMSREFAIVEEPRWFRVFMTLKWAGALGLFLYFYLWFPYFPILEPIAVYNLIARAIVIIGLLGVSLISYYHDIAGIFSVSGRSQLIEKGIISIAAFVLDDDGVRTIAKIGFNFLPSYLREPTIEYLGINYVSALGQGHSYVEGAFTFPVGSYLDREAIVFSRRIANPTARDKRLQRQTLLVIALIYPKVMRGLFPSLSTIEKRGMELLNPLTTVQDITPDALQALMEYTLIGRTKLEVTPTSNGNSKQEKKY